MKTTIKQGLLVYFVFWTVALMPSASIAQQTKIVAPKNKYSVQDDIKLGQQAAAEVPRQMPIMNDPVTQHYVESVGRRLVAAIPPEFQHPEFNYTFQVVNASDINAFALPGGPMFVNRGMIQAAKNEGEMAGVMAHEISHVALRHGTAQATKQNSATSQLGRIGMILGGSVLMGQTGAELGNMAGQTWMLKYSREYESQADLLGAVIMARAGYDPHDLANMFQTIAGQGGGRGPQWLSDHPDPGNRFNTINKEADSLQVSANPIKVTQDFRRVQERLNGMPATRSTAELEREAQQNGGRQTGGGRTGGQQQDPMSGGRYYRNVEPPSAQMRDYTGASWLSMQVPDNWQQFGSQSGVSFAPQGAYGDQGITHGAMVGIKQSSSRDPLQATQNAINELLQGNTYLSQQGSTSRSSISGIQGYVTRLAGQSSVTGQTELVTIYTTMMRNGDLFYIATVSPQAESRNYDSAFRSMLRSVRLSN